ncbi:flagellar motor protein MotB [Thiomicrorhabdus sp.]|uniref:OmpA/MotB family protein n=1 Tax=Thiomicrorhabdus sp. TaxID=2039724 RepID=UPI0029C6900B|nr:flagellar motor protein MotB [Thiomicrorhabdus sp.]
MRHSDHEDGGAHGGSWKIALADLMTVLMVFFLVLWLVSVIDPEDRKAFINSITGDPPIGADIADDKLHPRQDTVNPLDLQPPASREEVEEVLREIDPKDISVEDTADFLKITLRSDSFFESGRATINDKTREKVEELGITLSKGRQLITITGYTDNIPINNLQFPSNWELSAARAATIARTFIYMGINQGRVTIEGKADNESVASNDSAYGRSLNRRVVIFVDKNKNFDGDQLQP